MRRGEERRGIIAGRLASSAHSGGRSINHQGLRVTSDSPATARPDLAGTSLSK